MARDMHLLRIRNIEISIKEVSILYYPVGTLLGEIPCVVT